VVPEVVGEDVGLIKDVTDTEGEDVADDDVHIDRVRRGDPVDVLDGIDVPEVITEFDADTVKDTNEVDDGDDDREGVSESLADADREFNAEFETVGVFRAVADRDDDDVTDDSPDIEIDAEEDAVTDAEPVTVKVALGEPVICLEGEVDPEADAEREELAECVETTLKELNADEEVDTVNVPTGDTVPGAVPVIRDVRDADAVAESNGEADVSADREIVVDDVPVEDAVAASTVEDTDGDEVCDRDFGGDELADELTEEVRDNCKVKGAVSDVVSVLSRESVLGPESVADVVEDADGQAEGDVEGVEEREMRGDFVRRDDSENEFVALEEEVDDTDIAGEPDAEGLLRAVGDIVCDVVIVSNIVCVALFVDVGDSESLADKEFMDDIEFIPVAEADGDGDMEGVEERVGESDTRADSLLYVDAVGDEDREAVTVADDEKVRSGL